jgi:hypothetical protein
MLVAERKSDDPVCGALVPMKGSSRNGNSVFPPPVTARGCQEPSTTVRLRVAQFDSNQKPYVAFGKVPSA